MTEALDTYFVLKQSLSICLHILYSIKGNTDGIYARFTSDKPTICVSLFVYKIPTISPHGNCRVATIIPNVDGTCNRDLY